MKKKFQSQYEQESLSNLGASIVVTIVIILGVLGDSIFNLF